MVKLSIMDLFIFCCVALILTWVWGWTQGYDVATIQVDSIAFIDKCQSLTDALDSIGR